VRHSRPDRRSSSATAGAVFRFGFQLSQIPEVEAGVGRSGSRSSASSPRWLRPRPSRRRGWSSTTEPWWSAVFPTCFAAGGAPACASGLTPLRGAGGAADERGARPAGGGTVAVRFERGRGVPGERGRRGGRRPQRQPRLVRTARTWCGISTAAVPAAVVRGGPWQVKIAVHVVALFQSRARGDAELVLRVGRRSSGATRTGPVRRRQENPESGILGLLVATSIQRRSLVSYDWTVTFRPSRGAEPRP